MQESDALVFLVCLLAVSSSALDLLPPFDPNDPSGCYVVTGTEVWDEGNIEGCVFITSTGHVICNGESSLDGPGARIIINGGSFTCNNRFNIGTDHDGYVWINHGGSFVQQCGGGDCEDGIKFPDNAGGVHRIWVIDGTLDAYSIEQKHDRDAVLIVGCNGMITVGQTEEGDDYNPDKWLINGDVYCDPSCNGEIMIIDLGGGRKQIVCFEITCQAMMPSPRDGARNEAAVTCNMVLSWNEGNCLGTKGRNFVYFGPCDIVTNQPSAPTAGWNTAPPAGAYLGYLYAGTKTKNVGMLPLWTTYCWRIDEGCADGSTCRGDVWTFTTGCQLLGGDANLDCVVNFLDYAAVASTWMDEEFFPEGCTP
ncbi:MAG TPA: hypothetical protein VMX13_13510 [Sedimentisphaerales bacterium]|nr:hypothetical protein [Sedimentisphaerales bacterium]